MTKFGKVLKVIFFEGNRRIAKRENDEFSNLNDDGSIYLDMNYEADKIILDLIMKSDSINLEGNRYKIVDREFKIDGLTLNLTLKK